MDELKDVVVKAIRRESRISSSGVDLTWWLDLRIIWNDFPYLYAQMVHELHGEHNIMAGIETCGWELVSCISREKRIRVDLNNPGIYIYSQKGEWDENEDLTCSALVDGVIRTEENISKAVGMLQENNIKLQNVMVVMDRRENPELPIDSLFKPEDFDLPLL